MKYPPDLLDEIRNRLPVSRIVERRVKLKRAGREFIGLSPFKTERTPSFTVNDQKGFYHCFASGEHGDIFKFLMATEGLSFPEAVERLAAEAAVPLPAPAAMDEAKSAGLDRLYGVLEEACVFFQAALRTREGETARAYLETRGAELSEVRAFRLGYAPDAKSSLKTHLALKAFSLPEMQDAGLVIHGEEIPVPYDRFRGRLVFPILDAKSRVIAFGARALRHDQQPKYLNSPETQLFHKGHVLFNIGQAREAARQAKAVIVAEGYMDVIALTRAGFGNSVAPLGTALTPGQLRLLWTMAPSPALCFDGDAAGQKAAHRALDTALPYLEPGRSLQFAFLPKGCDPDDMVRRGEKQELAGLLSHPVPLIDVLWNREQSRHPLETPEQRASLEARLMELAGQIEHKTLKYHYVAALRERLRQALRAPVSPSAHKGARRQNQTSRYGRPQGRLEQSSDRLRTGSLLASKIVQTSISSSAPRETLLISAMLRHPWLLDEFLEEIAAIPFHDRDCECLRGALLQIHHEHEHLDNHEVSQHLSRLGYVAEIDRVQRATEHNADVHFAWNAAKEQVLEGWYHVLTLHRRAGLPYSVQEAENDYLREPSAENFSKLSAIVRQGEIASP